MDKKNEKQKSNFFWKQSISLFLILNYDELNCNSYELNWNIEKQYKY